MANLPLFRIGDLEAKCIELGGMGVGVTTAENVVPWINQGGIAHIASVGLGLLHNTFKNYSEGNKIAFKREIQKAKSLIHGDDYSRLAVNIMSAISDWEGMVKIAVSEGVGMITNGAWSKHPIRLPDYIKNPELNPEYKDIKSNIIASSSRGAELICRWWYKQFKTFPDAITIEGPKAGGHLGFRDRKSLNDSNFLDDYLEIETRATRSYFDKEGLDVTLIVAGGLFGGDDIRKAREEWGADAVQIGTRAVTTKECPVHDNFKYAYLNATPEDLIFINSPVGLPGSAINSPFFETIPQEVKCNYRCLQTCKPQESEYCIARALVSARNGDLEKGFAFAGRNAYKCTRELCLDENGEFITIEKLFEQLSREYHNK